MRQYRKRQLEDKLLELSSSYSVITLMGPRQSGKTTLCRHAFPDLQYVSLESLDTRQFAIEDPRGFLAQYPQGAIFDEIQRAPDLPSYLQGIVDSPDFRGLFILTGSQNFSLSQTVNQSLAGRTAVLTLLPFSISETKERLSLEEFLYRGFYPRIYDQEMNPTRALSDYAATYIERDLRQLSLVKDLTTFQNFMRACASRVGQLLNIQSLCNDLGIKNSTAKDWLSLLEASYIVFSLRPFFSNIGKRLVKSPKLYFYDPGLVSFLLGIENVAQLNSHPLKGAFFENLVATEILKFSFHRANTLNLMFYRDSNGSEVDFLLSRGNNYVPIEVKLGKTLSKDQFTGLKNFTNLDISTKGGMLVYGGGESKKMFGFDAVSLEDLDTSLNGILNF